MPTVRYSILECHARGALKFPAVGCGILCGFLVLDVEFATRAGRWLVVVVVAQYGS